MKNPCSHIYPADKTGEQHEAIEPLAGSPEIGVCSLCGTLIDFPEEDDHNPPENGDGTMNRLKEI